MCWLWFMRQTDWKKCWCISLHKWICYPAPKRSVSCSFYLLQSEKSAYFRRFNARKCIFLSFLGYDICIKCARKHNNRLARYSALIIQTLPESDNNFACQDAKQLTELFKNLNYHSVCNTLLRKMYASEQKRISENGSVRQTISILSTRLFLSHTDYPPWVLFTKSLGRDSILKIKENSFQRHT